ncbi:piggyBac transposable element-derived protein 4-like [Aricia agestis]|uniref:piggyBac transposable element-derived protein 4-like n=1 Tax=Aricia agestis TaxID=91739 RepID=UPI001C20A134|nr:piggyBac transposable element-derived protein 4-like [Aricia agestis]
MIKKDLCEFSESDDEKPLTRHIKTRKKLQRFEDDDDEKDAFLNQKQNDDPDSPNNNPLPIFEKFFTNEIVQEIVRCTNIFIEKLSRKYKNSSGFTNVDEIKALLGVLILTAAMNENHFRTEDIFNSEIHGSQYVSCMSLQRFSFLVQNICFNDKETEENESDPFSPMRNIWDLLMTQCRNNSILGSNVTIDEILVPFRGSCSFKMFLPDNEKKYGIKIMTMCDSSSYYMIDAMPHLGKYTKTDGCSASEFYIKELTKSIHGTKTNVTVKGLKPSIYLAEQMLEKPYNLTMISSVKASNKEIPKVLKRNTNRSIETPSFSTVGSVTFMSYNLDSNAIRYLLATNDDKNAILENYDATKNSVVAFDQMCSDMSCKRKGNNWTTILFYHLINIVSVNSYILYCQNSKNDNRKPIQRRVFMNKLHADLANPWRKIRFGLSNMPRTVKNDILAVLNKQKKECPGIAKEKKEVPEGKRRACSMCHYKLNRKTRNVCKKCKQFICGQHTASVCVICAEDLVAIRH